MQKFFAPVAKKEGVEVRKSYIDEAFAAIRKNDKEKLFELLSEKKIDPNATRNNWSLLQIAVLQVTREHNSRGFGKLDRDSMIQMLLTSGADINYIYQTKTNKKITALHLAVDQLLPEVVDILLANSANTMIENEKGQTAFALFTDKYAHITTTEEKIDMSHIQERVRQIAAIFQAWQPKFIKYKK